MPHTFAPDSLVLLSVLLEQETELEPVKIMTDTGAYTDAIFSIFYLFSFQFSPRIADSGGARLWCIDPKADYGAFNRLATDRVKLNLIGEQWDDLLRLAGSLKLGVGTDANAANQQQPEGFQLLDDDVARLSLLGHEHINMLGRYTVTLPDCIARGELRPLRDPNQPADEAWVHYLVILFRCYSNPYSDLLISGTNERCVWVISSRR